MDQLYSIPSLRVARLMFELRPAAKISLPMAARTNVLRGALGTTLRKAMCRPDCTEGPDCPHRTECGYAMLFEPEWQAGARAFRCGEAPRAYLFRACQDSDPDIGPDRPLRFELRLFGRAVEVAQFFIFAFQQLKFTGLAGQSATLASVHSLNWAGETSGTLVQDGTVNGDSPDVLTLSDIPPCAVADTVTVQFLTPVRLTDRNSAGRQPAFGALIRRLRDRLSALCRLHEGKEWQADFAAISRVAESAVSDGSPGVWSETWRHSSRSRKHMSLEGFLGAVTYRNVSQELMPLLRIGEEIHVGRHTVWGYGHYHCIPA